MFLVRNYYSKLSNLVDGRNPCFVVYKQVLLLMLTSPLKHEPLARLFVRTGFLEVLQHPFCYIKHQNVVVSHILIEETVSRVRTSTGIKLQPFQFGSLSSQIAAKPTICDVWRFKYYSRAIQRSRAFVPKLLLFTVFFSNKFGACDLLDSVKLAF